MAPVVTVVERLDLDRGQIVDGAVGAFVVEPVHPVQGRELDVIDAPPRAVRADELGLVQADLGLGQGVVVGLTG